MLFVFLYVDLISMFRADIRADIEAGKVFAFAFLSLVLPVRIARTANLVLAALYAITVVGGAIGEWNYYILGSAVEVALLAGIAYYAWTWPKASDATTIQSGQIQSGRPGTGTHVDSASKVRGSSAVDVHRRSR